MKIYILHLLNKKTTCKLTQYIHEIETKQKYFKVNSEI